MHPSSSHAFHARHGLAGLRATAAKKIALHPLERILVALILLQLVFLPWALGGLRLWSQYVSAGLAVVTFIVALWPRHYTELNSRVGAHHLSLWPRLLHFPLFWLGLLLMLYVTIQGLNPAWTFAEGHKMWWMQRINHIAWLPHGTIAPGLRGNPWTSLLVYGATWLTACSLWVGITRRRSLYILLLGLAINALLLAGIAFAQRLSNTNLILWFIKSPNQIWGTFTYRNHGGAWFNLMVPVFFGLAFWHYLRSLRTFAKSSPAALYGFLGLVAVVAVIASYSRGAVIAQLLFLGLVLVYFLIKQFTLPPFPQKHIVTALLLIAFAGFTFVGLKGLNAKETWDRMEQLFDGETKSLEARQLATKATLDMWQAEPWLGHGAHSFQYLFPIYQKRYPEIWALPYRHGKTTLYRRYFWANAHNDFAQTLAELGIIGTLPILLGGLWGLVRFLRTKGWANPVTMLILFTLSCTLAHSWGEFVFQCPAILVTWVALGVLSLRWTEVDTRHQSR